MMAYSIIIEGCRKGFIVWHHAVLKHTYIHTALVPILVPVHTFWHFFPCTYMYVPVCYRLQRYSLLQVMRGCPSRHQCGWCLRLATWRQPLQPQSAEQASYLPIPLTLVGIREWLKDDGCVLENHWCMCCTDVCSTHVKGVLSHRKKAWEQMCKGKECHMHIYISCVRLLCTHVHAQHVWIIALLRDM